MSFRQWLKLMAARTVNAVRSVFWVSVVISIFYEVGRGTPAGRWLAVFLQSRRSAGTVGAHGELRLDGLPFEPGQPVEVLVVLKATELGVTAIRSLRDSVLELLEPTEPVAGENWDALL